MAIKKGVARKKEEISIVKEKAEDIYTLIKMVTGAILGVILGFMKITGLLGFIIGILAILAIFVFGRYALDLKEVHPARLLLWDGTFTFFILLILTWTLVFNFTVPLSYP